MYSRPEADSSHGMNTVDWNIVWNVRGSALGLRIGYVCSAERREEIADSSSQAYAETLSEMNQALTMGGFMLVRCLSTMRACFGSQLATSTRRCLIVGQ